MASAASAAAAAAAATTAFRRDCAAVRRLGGSDGEESFPPAPPLSTPEEGRLDLGPVLFVSLLFCVDGCFFLVLFFPYSSRRIVSDRIGPEDEKAESYSGGRVDRISSSPKVEPNWIGSSSIPVLNRCFTGFYWGCTGFYWFSLGFPGLSWALLGLTGFSYVLLFFYWVLLVFTGF